MATTHTFASDAGFAAGGTWFDDYGRKICSWIWDPSVRILTVECGSRGQKIDLSSFDKQNLSDEKLRKQLPTLAIEAAEKIKGTKYDV